MSIDTEFQVYIRSQMERKGWTQQQFADKAGISRNSVQRLIGDTEHLPSAEIIVCAANALGLHDADLLRRAGLIDPEPDTVLEMRELSSVYEKLTPTARLLLLDMAHLLLKRGD